MKHKRTLVVMADDFGFGPATSQGILELAQRGLVTGSVLLVNSPYAESAVRAWCQAGGPLELGWHPTLTSDGPVLPPDQVPSLVGPDGRFCPLGRLVKRLFLGRVAAAEIAAEFRAQHRRFCDLVGHPPTVVNSHQHIALFQPVGFLLMEMLAQKRPLAYVRRIQEPWRMLVIPGARCKRAFLTFLGRPLAREQKMIGFPGNDWLAGITDPRWVRDPQFLVRWLRRIPGNVVELACHPGHYDATLIGRDCTASDGLLERRVDEYALLNHSTFVEACTDAGFERVAPAHITSSPWIVPTHAA